ncbi:hypothetical protein CTEN210_07795 [Chaetoceros tenuissimus]|uniref:Uncharacterized protein n=1 Tax=Chaetoceros tenuissimus TaxID=426638 RepID=A0AAD3H640_9STRA|nr:hypothetical protein CTEN210_07795 [Chaetoceros tenuissimus]
MVVYILYVKAELEGIGSISISPTANLCMDVRNPSTGDEIRERVVIDPNEFVEQEEGAREPPHHFSLKWEDSKKASTLTVLSAAELKTALKKKKGKSKGKDPYMIRNVTAEDNNEYVPVAAFETRGIEPYAFHPMGGEFIVESEAGMQFDAEDVDLSDDWADYDTENDIAVSITEFQSKFDGTS